MALSIDSAEMRSLMGKRFVQIVFSNGDKTIAPYTREGVATFKAKYGIPLPLQPIRPGNVPPFSLQLVPPRMHQEDSSHSQQFKIFSAAVDSFDGNHVPQTIRSDPSQAQGTLPAYQYLPIQPNHVNTQGPTDFSIENDGFCGRDVGVAPPRVPSTTAHHLIIPARQQSILPNPVSDEDVSICNEPYIDGHDTARQQQTPNPTLAQIEIAHIDAMILSAFTIKQLAATYDPYEFCEAFTSDQIRAKLGGRLTRLGRGRAHE